MNGFGIPEQIGKFQIRARLGAGGFGAVYRAYDPQLDREVALKVPHPGTLDTTEAVQRFLREAKTAARLHHPQIVPVHDYGQDGPHPYIASAYIAGVPLSHEINDRVIDPHRAARIILDLAGALAYAHHEGIVHRDVKPDNVMVDPKGDDYLVDFGLAY
ncbi:MAG TPA: serine/threonine-protein kinase [Isosphaeraceae bacterium]